MPVTKRAVLDAVGSVQAVVAKLHPRRYPGMSAKMAALVAYILGQDDWTNPSIAELVVTSDRCVLAQNSGDVGMNFIGSLDDLRGNWNRLLDCAGLTPAERRVAEAAFVRRVPTGG